MAGGGQQSPYIRGRGALRARAAEIARGIASRISPRHRRWRQLIESCELDPSLLPLPVRPPGPDDFIICGAPRSGTALATAALFQPPQIVTVMEPWDGLRLPPDQLFASLREELAGGSLQRGRLDVGALEQNGSVRWCGDGELRHEVRVDPGHLLGVKWPSFWQYLELLPDTRFVVCLREPSEVVASYASKDGRLGIGLEYDVPFNRNTNRELEQVEDLASRRVALYDLVYERILPHLSRPNVFALRYERWFDDRQQLVSELSDFLGVSLDPDRVDIRPPVHRSTEQSLPVPSRTAARLGY
jgi:hypothetical protein